MVTRTPSLGTGIYTVSEAAFYARIHAKTLDRWLHGSAESEAALRLDDDGEKLVTFVDFVEALAVRAIRLEHKLSLRKIRQAVKVAEEHYGVRRLLARKHSTYLFAGELFLRTPEDERSPEEQHAQISGKFLHNRLMKPIVEVYLDDVGFDSTGLAEKYRLFAWNTTAIFMNPRVHFGEPILPSGYSLVALWEASTAEGSIEAAAKAYGIPIDEVSLARRCYDHLLGRSAA